MPSQKKLYKVAVPDTQYCFRPNLFIWPNRTLLFGPIQQLAAHAMGSIAINIGLYQPFFVAGNDGTLAAYRCAIIPPGCRHTIIAHGNIMASLIIEKTSADYFRIKEHFCFHELKITEIYAPELIKCLQSIYQDKPTKNEIESLLNKLLHNNGQAIQNIDPRITKAMKVIQREPEKVSCQENLATELELSASRFRHLFRQHAGIPFRRYRMWRRVISAMSHLHKEDSLTYAAIDAGFTDSAHFNRCFQDILGVNPSLFFKNIDRFEI